eukprot:747189-Hanusia_phi.AAC.1
MAVVSLTKLGQGDKGVTPALQIYSRRLNPLKVSTTPAVPYPPEWAKFNIKPLLCDGQPTVNFRVTGGGGPQDRSMPEG